MPTREPSLVLKLEWDVGLRHQQPIQGTIRVVKRVAQSLHGVNTLAFWKGGHCAKTGMRCWGVPQWTDKWKCEVAPSLNCNYRIVFHVLQSYRKFKCFHTSILLSICMFFKISIWNIKNPIEAERKQQESSRTNVVHRFPLCPRQRINALFFELLDFSVGWQSLPIPPQSASWGPHPNSPMSCSRQRASELCLTSSTSRMDDNPPQTLSNMPLRSTHKLSSNVFLTRALVIQTVGFNCMQWRVRLGPSCECWKPKWDLRSQPWTRRLLPTS